MRISTAWDTASGQLRWSRDLGPGPDVVPGSNPWGGLQGGLYVSTYEHDQGLTVVALDIEDGSPRWETSLYSDGDAIAGNRLPDSLLVSDRHVVVCELSGVWFLDLQTGEQTGFYGHEL